MKAKRASMSTYAHIAAKLLIPANTVLSRGSSGASRIPDEIVDSASIIMTVNSAKRSMPEPRNAFLKLLKPVRSIPPTVIFSFFAAQLKQAMSPDSSTNVKNPETKSNIVITKIVAGLCR